METPSNDNPERTGNRSWELQRKILELLSSRYSNISKVDIRGQYDKSRFVKPSLNGVRDITRVENTIIDCLPPHYNHIRVSELVPLGIYHFLSWMSPNRSMQTSRWYELSSDLSVSLALEGLSQRRKKILGPLFFSWFDTTLRPQNFFWADNKNIPHTHFSIYANAILGEEKKEFFFTKKYLKALLEHYLDVLQTLSTQWFAFEDIEIELADMRHSQELLHTHEHTLHEFRDYQLKQRSIDGIEPTMGEFLWVPLQEKHADVNSLSHHTDELGLNLNLWYLISIYQQVNKLQYTYPIRTSLRLWRSRWAGQYSSIAFNIFATNKDGVRLDLADGWVTNRWEKLVSPTERCIVGWLGTDLIANIYKK